MTTPNSLPGVDDTGRDIALVERMVARDVRAVGELYDRHGRLLFGLILRILRDRGEAEEVLQEVFIEVWTHADTYNVVLASPVAWLVSVARSRAIDRLRIKSVRLRAVDAAPLPEDPIALDAEAQMSDGQRAVIRALDSLPPEQRELIEQAYFLGLTQSELAERHRLPLGIVKTRIRMGLLALRQQLIQTVGD